MSHFRQLKKGDHISVNGLSSGGCSLSSSSSFYDHHGIYSDGYVYHFFGDTQRDASVKKSRIEDFLNGRSGLYRINYYEQSCYDSQRVVERADKIFRYGTWPEYDLVSNNCEHFATYCKTGIAYSNQVDGIFDIKFLNIIIKPLGIIIIIIILVAMVLTLRYVFTIGSNPNNLLHTRMN